MDRGTDCRGLSSGAGDTPHLSHPVARHTLPCPGPGTVRISVPGLERALQPCLPFPEPSTRPGGFIPAPVPVNGHRTSLTFSLPCLELPHSCSGRCRCRCVRAQARARIFVANGATARLATGHPGEESHCPHAIKIQFAERKPLRPQAPNCSVQARPESPPPQGIRQLSPISREIHPLQEPQRTISF